MNPVAASATPAMQNAIQFTSASGGAFQDVLDMAAPADMSAMPAMPAMPAIPAIPMNVQSLVLNVPVEANAVPAEQATPSPNLLAETPAPTADKASVTEAEKLIALVGPKPAIAVRGPKPVITDGKLEDDEKLDLEKVDAPLAKTDQKPVIASPIPLPSPAVVPQAVSVSQTAPQPETEADEVTSEAAPDTLRLDAQPARLQTRPSPLPVATEQTVKMQEKADLLPPANLDPVVAEASGFETRFGFGLTTSAPAATTAAPAVVPNAVDTRQLILDQDREWIGALSRDIASHSSRDNHLQFTLMPESLGQLDVTLTTGKGQVDVRLDASTAAAAQIIVADQARLIEDLRAAGLKLGQFEMTNRQNSNGQQRQHTPDHPSTESTSTTTQPVAQSKAVGRFA